MSMTLVFHGENRRQCMQGNTEKDKTTTTLKRKGLVMIVED
jgi:hypothetical protein